MKKTATSKTAKIIAVIFMVATILGVFSIFPSAQSGNLSIAKGYYVFNEVLSFDEFDGDWDASIRFSVNGMNCDVIASDGITYLEYWNVDGDGYMVYDSENEDGWVDDVYRIIYLYEDFEASSPTFVEWFENNTEPMSFSAIESKKGMYKDIEYILTSTIYDVDFADLDSFQKMTITLLSTVASVAVVALPLIVVYWLIKFIFSFSKYF